MKSKESVPSSSAPGSSTLELGDIQGLVVRGYSYFNIRYFILNIRDGVPGGVEGAQALLRAILPGGGAPLTITTAQPWGSVDPPYCLNIGVTSAGLTKLIGTSNYGTVQSATTEILDSFIAGAVAQANYVGDTGTSAPANWWPEPNWKLPSRPSNDAMDLLICLYTRDPAVRDQLTTTLLEMIPNCADGQPAVVPVFVQDADPLPPVTGAPAESIPIHFGYADGFSQPRIQGTPWDDPGDPNDDSPMVPAQHFVVAPVADYYNAHSFLVNGSFGAFRLLYQDVEAFHNFLGSSATQSPAVLAAKMCGRWLDGTPLEVSPDSPHPNPPLTGVDFTNFDYLNATPHQKGPRESDAFGQNCPYAAHTRRTNPRDDTFVLGDTASDGSHPYAEMHRIRRFATPYGPPYVPNSDVNDEPRGLVGLFMGANLSLQFEFIMQTWISSLPGQFRFPDQSPNTSGIDPLFGPQDDDSQSGDFEFDYCISPPSTYTTVPDLSRFIVTKGGLYVFLPSVTALGLMAKGEIVPTGC